MQDPTHHLELGPVVHQGPDQVVGWSKSDTVEGRWWDLGQDPSGRGGRGVGVKKRLEKEYQISM